MVVDMNHAFLQLAAFGEIAAKVALIVAVGFINNFKEGILEIVLQKIFQEFLFCNRPLPGELLYISNKIFSQYQF